VSSPLRHLAAALAAGTLVGLLAPWAATGCAAALTAVAALLRLRSGERRAWLAACMALGAALGALRGSSVPQPLAGEAAPREQVALRGVVTRGPDVARRPGFPGGRHVTAVVRIRVEDVSGASAARPFGAVVRIDLDEDEPPELLPGDRVALVGWLRPIAGPSNPGRTDRRARLAREGVTHQVRVAAPDAVRRVGRASGPSWSLRRWGERTRRAAIARLRSACAGRTGAAALLACLLVGDRSGLSRRTRDGFRDAGVAHLLAVSGLHVVLLTSVLGSAGRALTPPTARRWAAVPATALLLLAYCATCRFATPVVRAATFLMIRPVARRMGRRSATLDQLACAACLVLGADPGQVLDTGFHLSFAAVAGLILLRRGLQDALFPHLDLLRRFPEAVPAWRLRLETRLAQGLSAACAAQVATAPVVATAFGELHALGPLANLLAIPVTAVVLPSAALLACLGGALSEITSPLAGLLTGVLEGVVRATPRLPPVLDAPGRPPTAALVLSVALLAAAAGVRRWRRRHLLLPLAAWGVLVAHGALEGDSRENEVLALDVGHGLATLVRSDEGADVLFDAGGRLPGTAERVIVPALRAVGVRRLAAVVVSHEDTDHSGGVAAVLDAIRVDEVVVPAGFGGGRVPRALLRECRRRCVPVRVVARGDVWRRPGLTLRVLHPPPGAGGPARNPGSLVVHVAAGRGADSISALLPGDLVGPALHALAADPTLPRADVLLLPHHGLEDLGVQRRLARRARARVLVASAPVFAPVRVPEALVTGRDGAVRVRSGEPPRTFREQSRERPDR
jgi:competence protein ComEC